MHPLVLVALAVALAKCAPTPPEPLPHSQNTLDAGTKPPDANGTKGDDAGVSSPDATPTDIYIADAPSNLPDAGFANDAAHGQDATLSPDANMSLPDAGDRDTGPRDAGIAPTVDAGSNNPDVYTPPRDAGSRLDSGSPSDSGSPPPSGQYVCIAHAGDSYGNWYATRMRSTRFSISPISFTAATEFMAAQGTNPQIERSRQTLASSRWPQNGQVIPSGFENLTGRWELRADLSSASPLMYIDSYTINGQLSNQILLPMTFAADEFVPPDPIEFDTSNEIYLGATPALGVPIRCTAPQPTPCNAIEGELAQGDASWAPIEPTNARITRVKIDCIK